MVGYILDACPTEICDAWAVQTIDNPLTNTKSTSPRIFSGPALMSMQSHLPTLTLLPEKDHILSLSTAGHSARHAAATALEKARQKLLDRNKKKDGTPKIKKEIDVLPQRNDEELKLRKVVKHEIDHYDLSKPESPRKQPKPNGPLTPLTSPSKELKSILKSSSVAEDIPETSPLKGISIRRTASAKLNYLLERILGVYKEEKIIVFSDYGPMMWYLSEALEVLGIQHLIYIQRLVTHAT
jgi:hypothetical protein